MKFDNFDRILYLHFLVDFSDGSYFIGAIRTVSGSIDWKLNGEEKKTFLVTT